MKYRFHRALSLLLVLLLTASMSLSALAAEPDTAEDGMMATTMAPAEDGMMTTTAAPVDEDTAGYLILGADLNDKQKDTVLKLLGVSDINNYTVSYTTNAEEKERFGSYLSSSVIGSRALSSILLMPAKKGSGISVTTYNINYCTDTMYQSALADAGVSDVVVYVAGPIELSGTCALASAMKAYTLMTGEQLSEDSMDAAAEEIVTTGQISEAVGDPDTATKLIAIMKEKVLTQDLSEKEIGELLDQVCENLGISLRDDLRQQIIDLLIKLKNTDIDFDKLKEQASSLYSSIRDEVAKLEANGTLDKLFAWLQKLVNAILSLFNGGNQ